MFRRLSLVIACFCLRQTLAAASYSSPIMLTVSYTAANTYSDAYLQFGNSSLTIPANARLEYDVFVPIDSADFNGAVDFGNVPSGSGAMTDLRDYQAPSTGLYIRDQNYLRAHPYSDISPYAKGKWYHRVFDVGSAAGLLINGLALATDTGNNTGNGSPANLAGYYNCYFDNIRFTNAYGVTLTSLYSNDGVLPMGGTSSTTNWAGASNGSVDPSTLRISVVTGLQFSASP
ncbi:MAG TPA: hypothetical protein VNZ54_11380, partial [bacterium]|nr:hypothetical protein [bacterium]